MVTRSTATTACLSLLVHPTYFDGDGDHEGDGDGDGGLPFPKSLCAGSNAAPLSTNEARKLGGDTFTAKKNL